MATILKFWRQSRDRDALAAALRPHIAELYRLAYRLTGNEADSEDLLQDLVIKLHGRGDEIASLDKPGIWLARVLYRQYVDSYRRAVRRPLSASELDCDETDEDPVAGLAEHASRQPERLTEQRMEAGRLQAALDSLNPAQRDVVMLHDVEGYRLTELEDVLSQPVGTLKSRLHRGRRRLRERLVDGTI